MNEREVFIEALQRTDPAERSAYLEQTFVGDAAFRRRIEILLDADHEARQVLNETAPTDLAAPLTNGSSPTTTTECATDADPPSTLPFDDAPDVAPLTTTEPATSADSTSNLSFLQDTGEPSPLPTKERFDSDLTLDAPPGARLRSPDVRGLSYFELLAEIGRGGMGVVYKARHRPLNRIVALKMILDGKHAHSEHRDRFRIEAEAVARLRHPNIVQIYEFGESDGCPFVTFELLEGGSLADRLRGTTQPSRAAAALVATLARAMHAAHQAGIVHRDLKPSNILFDGDGTPKITDFGLAKRLEVEEGDTVTGQVMGTPSYMAFEQAQGDVRQIGPPADVYALGAILYEMLTGRPPFKGASKMETIRQVVYDDVVPPSRIERRIARDLETICLKCLQKEPAKRYGTALELAEDLDRYLDDRPIRARRTPLWERGAKWVRRHPAATTLLALATAAVVTLAVLAVHQEARQRAVVRAEDERVARRRADSERVLEDAENRLLEKGWADGRLIRILSDLATVLAGEPGLANVRERAERLRDRAERGLREESDQSRAHARQREFIEHRNNAFLYATHFTGLDLPKDVRQTRAAAQAGLAVFAVPGAADVWSFAPLPRFLSPQEQAEIEDGRYELLLVLAEALADALPGEDSIVQAGHGLRILDQALGLRAEPTPAWHRARAACLATKGDEDGAAREKDAAGRLRPSTALDHFLAGREAYRRQDWRAVQTEFETVLRMQPGHFWAQCLSAIASLQSNQPGMAKLGLSACIEHEPRFVWLYILRGMAAGQAAVQARVAGKTLKIEDGSIEAAVEVQFETAEADFQKAFELLEARPNDELRWVAMVDRALVRFQRGRLAEAVADLEAAIRLEGRQSIAYASLAQVLQRQQKWDEAVERFTQAIRLKPQWAPLYRGRAGVEQERDDPSPAHRAAALRDLEDAIRYENPGNPILANDHFRRGELLRRDGRFEEALAACDAALKVLPDFDTAHRLRVRVLLDLDRPDAVIRACDASLARGKPWADIHEIRGLARANHSDYIGAIDDYSQALVLRPGQPRVLTARGLAYLVVEAPTLALHDFDEALRHDASNGETHSGRGQALVHLGDYQAAIAAAEESLRHDAPTARRAYNAARVYAQAAIAAAAEVGEKGRLAAPLVERCQDRAVALVRLALERTPVERRAAFWKDQVAADPALRSLQRRLRSLQPVESGSSLPEGQRKGGGGAATLTRPAASLSRWERESDGKDWPPLPPGEGWGEGASRNVGRFRDREHCWRRGHPLYG